jgi:hypothetical protein
MAWATAFISALAADDLWMRFALVRGALWDEYTPSPHPWAVLSHVGDPVLLADFPGAAAGCEIDVDAGALAVTDTSLDMRACRGGGSGLTVHIIGAPDGLRAAMVQLTPGAFVELACYVSTDSGATWLDEVVFSGRIQSMRRAGVRLEVDVAGIDAALGRRPNGTLSRAGLLLIDTGGTPSTSIASGYTPGDSHLHVSTLPSWGAPTAPAKNVAVLTDATNGEEFAVTWTGTATGPNRITGLPSVSTVSTSSSAVGGGDVVDSGGRPVATYKERIANDPPLDHRSSSDTVRFPAYYNGHPIAVARRILTSRGSVGPANGADDVLPWQWALGVKRAALDTTDMAAEEAGTSGALVERLEELRERSDGVDGQALLDELMGQAGFFLAQRHGRLTVRAVPDPFASGIVSLAIGGEDLAVTAADALAGGEGEPVDHDPWPAAFPVFRQLLYVANARAYHVRSYAYTAGTQATLTDGAAEVVLTDRWGPHGASDSAVVEAGDRLAPSQMMVPEVYRLALRGLRWAALTKGDFVSLTLPSEISRQGIGLVDGLLGVVLSVSVDWLAGTAQIEAACFDPAYDPEDPPILQLSDVYSGGQD